MAEKYLFQKQKCRNSILLRPRYSVRGSLGEEHLKRIHIISGHIKQVLAGHEDITYESVFEFLNELKSYKKKTDNNDEIKKLDKYIKHLEGMQQSLQSESDSEDIYSETLTVSKDDIRERNDTKEESVKITKSKSTVNISNICTESCESKFGEANRNYSETTNNIIKCKPTESNAIFIDDQCAHICENNANSKIPIDIVYNTTTNDKTNGICENNSNETDKNNSENLIFTETNTYPDYGGNVMCIESHKSNFVGTTIINYSEIPVDILLNSVESINILIEDKSADTKTSNNNTKEPIIDYTENSDFTDTNGGNAMCTESHENNVEMNINHSETPIDISNSGEINNILIRDKRAEIDKETCENNTEEAKDSETPDYVFDLLPKDVNSIHLDENPFKINENSTENRKNISETRVIEINYSSQETYCSEFESKTNTTYTNKENKSPKTITKISAKLQKLKIIPSKNKFNEEIFFKSERDIPNKVKRGSKYRGIKNTVRKQISKPKAVLKRQDRVKHTQTLLLNYTPDESSPYSEQFLSHCEKTKNFQEKLPLDGINTSSENGAQLLINDNPKYVPNDKIEEYNCGMPTIIENINPKNSIVDRTDFSKEINQNKLHEDVVHQNLKFSSNENKTLCLERFKDRSFNNEVEDVQLNHEVNNIETTNFNDTENLKQNNSSSILTKNSNSDDIHENRKTDVVNNTLPISSEETCENIQKVTPCNFKLAPNVSLLTNIANYKRTIVQKLLEIEDSGVNIYRDLSLGSKLKSNKFKSLFQRREKNDNNTASQNTKKCSLKKQLYPDNFEDVRTFLRNDNKTTYTTDEVVVMSPMSE